MNGRNLIPDAQVLAPQQHATDGRDAVAGMILLPSQVARALCGCLELPDTAKQTRTRMLLVALVQPVSFVLYGHESRMNDLTLPCVVI